MNTCRDLFLCQIRTWIVQEQLRRIKHYGQDTELYNHHIGYMLCLSNLVDVLVEIEKSIECNVINHLDS
jgi:Uri superfamily endonuclease